MDKKGFWALLASVSKAWKTIFTRTNDSFRYRQAAGDDNILLPEKNGRAVIDTIYGNTVKWNQLVQNGDFSNGTTGWYSRQSGGIAVTNGILSFVKKATSNTNNFSQNITLISGHKYIITFDLISKDSNAVVHLRASSNANLTENVKTILTSSQFTLGKNSIIYTGSATDAYIGFSTISDTTELETVLLSIDNFEIIDLTLLGIDNLITVAAFEVWLSLNVGEQDYYPYDEGSLVSFKGQGVRTVKNNVELDRLELDVTKIYGKVNGQGSYVQCYPNGMKSTSKFTDLLSKDTAVIYGGIVAFKDLTFSTTSMTHVFQTSNIPLIKTTPNIAEYQPQIGLLLSNQYKPTDVTWFSSNLNNNDITINAGTFPTLVFRDDRFTTVGDIGSNLDNVYAVYEYATPITYTNLIYSEDGGVTGIPLKELAYKVDKYSTEELLVPTSVNGEPTSTAIVADIEYQKKG